MRSFICAGLGTFVCCSASCVAFDNNATSPDQTNDRVGRTAALIEHMNTTMTELAADVTPIAAALRGEILREAKSDMPSIAEELQSQVTNLSPLRKSRQPSP